jgi:hypothetical protein
MKIKALNNQSLLDVSLQTTGKPENYLKIAMANNLVPSETLPAGLEIAIPDNVEIENEIKRYYNANEILPATELQGAFTVPELNCEEKLYECFK